MKAIRFFWQHILAPACLIFAVLTFFFAGVMSSSGSQYVPTLATLGKLFAFGVMFSLSNLFLRIEKLAIGWRYLLNFGGILGSFYLLLFLLSDQKGNGMVLLIFGILFAVLYGIFILIRTLTQRTADAAKAEPYRSQFR